MTYPTPFFNEWPFFLRNNLSEEYKGELFGPISFLLALRSLVLSLNVLFTYADSPTEIPRRKLRLEFDTDGHWIESVYSRTYLLSIKWRGPFLIFDGIIRPYRAFEKSMVGFASKY